MNAKLAPLGLCLAVGLSVGCRHQAAAPAAPPDPLTIGIDSSVNPGVDFFDYANGAWLEKNPIPDTESAWGIGNEVQDEIYTKLRTISEQAAAAKASPGSDQQKVGDFWAMAMDSATADRLGATPLQPELQQIAAVQNAQQALAEAGRLRPLGVNAFYGFGIEQDEKDSAAMTVHLGQGGLGLPNRDFYFNKEAGVAHIRDEYVAHMGRVLQLLGDSPADAATGAAGVMGFETALAGASRKLADLRDPYRNYNKMSPAELTARYTPDIHWNERFATFKLTPASVVVGQPEFFSGLDKTLAKTPAPVLRDYLRLHLVDAYAPYLGQKFFNEDFRFNQVMSGQKTPRPEWKRALASENRALGMVLGRMFVQAYFPPAAKARYTALVEAIRSAYRDRIAKLDWMSPATKTKALAKLNAITPKVGYPDHWKDDSALVVARNSYAENMMNASRWRFQDMLAKYGHPVDRTEWDMTPQTYNAYYNPSNNEIVLPAAQFAVPGVPDADLDDAIVYGYSGGSTIGHEITHGFDDEGRHFDAQGNLKDWWTTQDSVQFNQRAAVMAKQFDAYEPIPGLHINGQACLGENIADFGGLMLGLDAFEKTEEYKAGKKIDGLTPLQRYFLGYALGWREHEREASLRRQLLSDVHAPAKYRVLGPLSDIPAFYQAFDVRQGQPMWRPADQRVSIW